MRVVIDAEPGYQFPWAQSSRDAVVCWEHIEPKIAVVHQLHDHLGGSFLVMEHLHPEPSHAVKLVNLFDAGQYGGHLLVQKQCDGSKLERTAD